jgi:hypothetical protein
MFHGKLEFTEFLGDLFLGECTLSKLEQSSATFLNASIPDEPSG